MPYRETRGIKLGDERAIHWWMKLTVETESIAIEEYER